jgi:hypothetical protein
VVKVTLGIKFDREMGMGQSLSLPYCGEETSSYAILGYHPGAEKLATCSVVNFFLELFSGAADDPWIRQVRDCILNVMDQAPASFREW